MILSTEAFEEISECSDEAHSELCSAVQELNSLQTSKDHSVRVAKAQVIPPRTQQFVKVVCERPGLLVVTPHPRPVRNRLCVAARGLHDNTPGEPFHILMANLSDHPVQLALRMNVALVDDAPTMIVSTEDIFDSPQPSVSTVSRIEDDSTQEGEEEKTTKPYRTVTPGPVYLSQHAGNDKQRRSVVRPKTVNWTEAVTHKPKAQEDWRTKVHLGQIYEHFRDRVERLLKPFESMWSGHQG